MQQDVIVDLVAQIADEDVVVVRGILLVGVVGLVGPVDTNLLKVEIGIRLLTLLSAYY